MRRTVTAVVAVTVALGACDRSGDPIVPPSGATAPVVSAPTTTTSLPMGCDDELVADVLGLLQAQLDALGSTAAADVAADPGLRAREAEIAARMEAERCPPAELREMVLGAATLLDARDPAAARYLEILRDTLLDQMTEP